MAKVKDLNMVRGNTLAFSFKLKNLEQTLTGAYLSVKTDPSDSAYTLQKSLGDGIESLGEDTYKVRVAPDDTAELTPGQYYYDLTMVANNDVYTILTGALFVAWNITVVE